MPDALFSKFHARHENPMMLSTRLIKEFKMADAFASQKSKQREDFWSRIYFI